MASESVVKKYYRICTDAENKIFDRVAFWTLDGQVQNESTGKSLQETVGSIQGITNSLNTSATGFALDASAICLMSQAAYNALTTKENKLYLTY